MALGIDELFTPGLVFFCSTTGCMSFHGRILQFRRKLCFPHLYHGFHTVLEFYGSTIGVTK